MLWLQDHQKQTAPTSIEQVPKSTRAESAEEKKERKREAAEKRKKLSPLKNQLAKIDIASWAKVEANPFIK